MDILILLGIFGFVLMIVFAVKAIADNEKEEQREIEVYRQSHGGLAPIARYGSGDVAMSQGMSQASGLDVTDMMMGAIIYDALEHDQPQVIDVTPIQSAPQPDDTTCDSGSSSSDNDCSSSSDNSSSSDSSSSYDSSSSSSFDSGSSFSGGDSNSF